MTIDEVINHFKSNDVECKKVERESGNFIAIFSYGKLTRSEITKVIKDNNLLCMLFESSINENERKKRMGERE